MTAVDHTHFKASPLAAVCGDSILFYGFLYLRMIHLYCGDGFPAVHLCAPYFTGSNEGGSAEGRFPGFIEVRILPVVVDLQRGERSIAVAHFDKAGERKNTGVAAQVQLTLLITRLFDIDHGIADVNNCHPAFCDRSEKIDELRRRSPFPVSQVGRRRGHFQTVLEVNASDPDRLKHMFVF